ncbi:tripartite tricarboxylate transporter substrate binding protein [Cupriavidus necator]|uniref:Bug family tripartite tricarboxylate transporter substrate binding protein n=1 Tax=Cupriavidus necator TaxID=106590 RepID=UPI003ED0B732
MTFRSFATAALAACLTLPGVASAQTYPSKPVRMVSPYGPGGSNDISARIIAEGLGKKYGQQFVVENKPGAATRVANEMVAGAQPDGYTLLYAAAPFAINEAAGIKGHYDISKNFIAIGPRVVAPLFLIVNAASPIRNLADFVSFARERKDGVTFAGTGVGAAPHLTSELLANAAGFKILNVQYRGDATAYTELLAGRVDATLTAITSALPFIKAGRLRVIAIASEQRSPIYPEARTFSEFGYPTVIGYGWFGLLAPAGTPPAVVQQLNRDVNAVLADPGNKERLVNLGLQPESGSSEAFADFIGSEVAKWSAVIKRAGIVLE